MPHDTYSINLDSNDIKDETYFPKKKKNETYNSCVFGLSLYGKNFSALNITSFLTNICKN